MPITKHNFLVNRVENLADIIRDAFRIANTGRKGPVLIDIPKDVTFSKCEFESKTPVKVNQRYQKNMKAMQQVAEMINKAQKPVIYYGGGVGLSNAEAELNELVDKAGIPATYTIMAAGTLSDDKELNLGLIGMHGTWTANRAVSKADLVIAIGARFSDRVALNPKRFASEAKIIQIDIDISEVNKNVIVDVYLVGNVKQVLTDLLPMIEANEHPQWVEQIKKWQAEDYHPQDREDKLCPHQVMQTISELCGENTVYTTDVGQHQMWAAQFLHHVNPKSFLSSGGLGTMGFGYGAAIGASMAVKDTGKRVVHITGDGSFHMNLNEACTAVSYNLPIITVLMNNAVLGMVRQWQTAFYESRYSHTDPQRKTDFVKLGEAFGLIAFRATNPAEFRDAMEKALKVNGPVWIECVIEKDEKVLPMIPAGGTIEDIMMD